MKKSNKIFLITALVLVAVYIASAFTVLGKVFTPQSLWQIQTESEDREDMLASVSVTLDIARNKPDEETGEKVTAHIGRIYVYIGNVYSYTENDKGEQFVTLLFRFKTKSDKTSNKTTTNKKVEVNVPVIHKTGGYAWVKVYDSEDLNANGNKNGLIEYSRVSVSSPDSFDFHEVVFTDNTGYVLQTTVSDASYLTQNEREFASVIVDEQDTFTPSKAKRNCFTEEELKVLSSAQAIRTGSFEITDGPVNTLIHLLGITIFGKTPFGLRFFDCLAGLAIMLLLYSLIYKLFGKSRYAVLTVIFALALGSCFGASNFALGAVGAFFAFLSLYLSISYFVKHYYFEDANSAVGHLLLLGLAYGLAVASDMAYSLLIVGHVAILVMTAIRGYKQYKKDEKQAEGLGKEEVFLAYRKKRVVSSVATVTSLVVIPVAILVASFAVYSKAYTGVYGVGFVSSIAKHFVACITPAYQSNPLALLVGFGGITVGGYYSFINTFTAILSLICFIFVTVVVLFGSRIEIFKEVSGVINKYKMLTASFVSALVPVIFGLTSSPYGFALCSVFFVSYIAFAEDIIKKATRKKWIKGVLNACAVIGVITFAMAFVAYAGLVIPDSVANILYLWQVA